MLGAGILWFGWFGFNVADGLQANGVAAQALIKTQLAAAAAMLVWLLVDHFTDGHVSMCSDQPSLGYCLIREWR